MDKTFCIEAVEETTVADGLEKERNSASETISNPSSEKRLLTRNEASNRQL